MFLACLHKATAFNSVSAPKQMISPVEPKVRMEWIELEPGLKVYRCPKSQGYWIPESAYWKWTSTRPQRLEPLPADAGFDVEEEPGQPVRICPETGKLMTRYRVGKGFSFRIDRSPNGGIWLDAGEWEALKSRNFHDALLSVFTASWQKAIVKSEQAQSLTDQFRRRIGEDEFERVTEFKSWLKRQQDPEAILCFLQDDAL